MSNDYETGQKLLTAIEQITAPAEDLQALVARLRRESGGDREEVNRRIVARYSNLSAAVGAAAALPSMVPGLGTLSTAVAAPLVDMVAVLKLESEMCMALFASHDHDIRAPEERQLALLLAAVHTGGVATGRNVLLDVGAITTTAVWSYAPRELSKVLLVVLGHVAIAYAATRAARAKSSSHT